MRPSATWLLGPILKMGGHKMALFNPRQGPEISNRYAESASNSKPAQGMARRQDDACDHLSANQEDVLEGGVGETPCASISLGSRFDHFAFAVTIAIRMLRDFQEERIDAT